MSTTDAEVREMRRKVECAGLAVSNVSTGLHWRYPLSTREPEIRRQGIRIVERQLETAQPLGRDAILLVVLVAEIAQAWDQQFCDSATAMDRLISGRL